LNPISFTLFIDLEKTLPKTEDRIIIVVISINLILPYSHEE